MKTLIAPTPTDRTHVLVERDLLEMDLLVQVRRTFDAFVLFIIVFFCFVLFCFFNF